MKVYISERNGIAVVRLSGEVGVSDINSLLDSIGGKEEGISGCLILDFEEVAHINYRAFQLLEDALPANSKVILSGLNNYILDIFSFVRKKGNIPVYSNWRKALSFLTAVRGKIAEPSTGVAVK